jgi:hypothetical protein
VQCATRFSPTFRGAAVLAKLNKLFIEGFEIPERKDISVDSMLDLICNGTTPASHGFHDRKREAFARAAKQDKSAA